MPAAVVVFAFNAKSSAAAGFGVSPSALDFTVEEGSESSRQLTIYNTGPDAQFTAISEDPAIAVEPNSGLLENGKTTTLSVIAAGKKPGRSASEILISLVHNSGNPDGEVRLSLGTRIGVSIAVIESAVPSANFFVGMLTSAGIVVSGLSAYLALRKKNVRLLAKA